MTDWHFYEEEARRDGYPLVCGIDEAGRGPLAGPVFAAAVILPPQVQIEGLNDSKKLSPNKREELYDVICGTAQAYGVGFATEGEIDEINILQATFLAMRRAFDQLNLCPDCALVDGNRMPDLGVETRLIVKGDSLSASIAAASILAKVSRDRVMCRIDEIYPDYGFAKHKGYGTALHMDRLREKGPCPVHRRTFLKKILAGSGNE
ncbi:ribonuclease HII [Clostridium sp. W14A]|uniref:Ribonuclease HII n=1 Tax=Caproicibacter fermentans TaxID=2576756 RepID=A0A7G8TCI4_9FIRM|nr:ribonuclease HII [Caproicibacter fermentans]OCN02407.1 ribonuclease HII [Clostridium sp. W14A]QNK41325.1 ribonuclease HII [Caproicibacter fermentans]